MATDKNVVAPALLVQRSGAVETFTINDPPRTRLSLAFMDALETEVGRVARDSGVRAIVIRGAGEKSLAEERRAVLSTMGMPDQREGMQAFLEKRRPRFNREP